MNSFIHASKVSNTPQKGSEANACVQASIAASRTCSNSCLHIFIDDLAGWNSVLQQTCFSWLVLFAHLTDAATGSCISFRTCCESELQHFKRFQSIVAFAIVGDPILSMSRQVTPAFQVWIRCRVNTSDWFEITVLFLSQWTSQLCTHTCSTVLLDILKLINRCSSYTIYTHPIFISLW